MTTLVTAQSLSIKHTTSPLLEEVTLTIRKGDKIGLIGHNGSGKSTLLKLLSGKQHPTGGSVSRANSCFLQYVEQTVPDSIKSMPVSEALADVMSQDEAWRSELLLDELGFSLLDRKLPVHKCSGGQQMRLLLGRAVINSPDLLLLDEPSNHLDLHSLLWLERFLISWNGSFVLVSHDEAMLDSVTNKTLILRDKSLYQFSGCCTFARSELKARDEADLQRRSSELKEINRIDESAKRLANWGRIYDNQDLSRKAKTMQTRKERLVDDLTELTEGTPWKLQLIGERLQANRLVEIPPSTVKAPFSNIDLFEINRIQIKSGDRIGILGSNGCGKSTLLNLLYKEFSSSVSLSDTKSNIIFHNSCTIGYYDQNLAQLDDGSTIQDAVLSLVDVSFETCKLALINSGFAYNRHNQKVSSLSGGERSRLLFVCLTLSKYHLLLLDEPTNHLDIDGKQELIETLNDFEGAALIVSHDRKLIENSCNRFWFIHDNKLSEHLSVDEVYQQIEEISAPLIQLESETNTQHMKSRETNEEHLLERLIELEALLEADLNRKFKHQKLNLQKKWQDEIEAINTLLL